MCNANNEIVSKVQELMELRRMQEELQQDIDALQDAVKAYMGEEELMTAGAFKVSYKTVTTTRLDTTALKKVLPEVCERFTKQTVSKRFSVN